MKRKLIFRKYHDFGTSVGRHLVEVSVSKTRFYIVIIEKLNGVEYPHLIDIWVN